MAWLGTWDKRTKITIDNTNIDSDLSHFPVLVNLGTSVGQSSQDLSRVFDELTSDANRTKIAFTKSDGTTQIYGDIETWDDSSEKAVIHVSSSAFTAASGSTTDIYMYYDSAQPANTTYISDSGDTAAQSVYDSDFVGVWHMSQDPNGDVANAIKDSTSNNLDGTPDGTMTSADLVDGVVGEAIDFDGTDDYIECGDITEMDGETTATFEFAGKFDAFNANAGLIRKWAAGQNAFAFGFINSGSYNEINLAIRDASNNSLVTDTTNASLSTATDYYLASAWDGGNTSRHYKNTTLLTKSDTLTTNPSGIKNVTETLGLAGINNGGTPDKFVNGQVRELRLSKTNRSAAWLKATYYTLTDDLLTFGAEEDYSSFSASQPIIVITT